MTTNAPTAADLLEEVLRRAPETAATRHRETASERHGAKLAGHLDHPADRMPDPLQVVIAEKPKTSRERCYPTGTRDRRVNGAFCESAIETLCRRTIPDRDTRVGLVKLVMEAVKPKNELEVMLATQMIGAHAAAMEAYGRAARCETVPTIDTYLNQASKASRTYVTLLEALDRHRGKGGQQKVRVEHVHVYEGGQAIVGAVEGPRGSRGSKGNRSLSHAQRPAALSYAPVAPLRGQDTEREPVPGAGDAERSVSDARGQKPRRAAG